MTAIDEKFAAFGGPAFFGPPITPEIATADGVGRVRHWTNASIWWSPAHGAHEVHGQILDRYLSLGAESFLGHPITDEHATAAGGGRVSSFERGSIYWSPATQTHEVYGAISALWQSLGAEGGALGLPRTGELPHPSGFGSRYQRFQHGEIFWSLPTGAYTVAPGTPEPWADRLNTFAANRAPVPWHGLPRAMVATRLRELVREPDRLYWGSLNLCGPATFVRAWLRRDPLAFLDFATQLYDTGQSFIGNVKVAPDDDAVIGTDWQALPARFPGKIIPPAADWMVLGALRDAENAIFDYEGTPSEDISAITTGGEMEDWFNATGAFGTARDESNNLFTKGLPHALRMDPANNDVAMLVNMRVLGSDVDWYQRPFPNHWVGLEAPVITGNGLVRFVYWSWGRLHLSRKTVPVSLFEPDYYGTVIAP
jgi:hypothetical protein